MWMSQHLPVHRQFRVISFCAVPALFPYRQSQDLLVGNEDLNAALLPAAFRLQIRKVPELLPLFNVFLMSIFSMRKLVLSART